jgi:hypothetical protein
MRSALAGFIREAASGTLPLRNPPPLPEDSLRGAVGHGARLGALLALAQLLRCAPRAPMLQAAPALSPLLPECLLAMLAQPAGDEALLAAPLAAAGELLCEEEGRTALAEHAGPLLRALSAVAREGRSTPPDARATALQAITACASLPYAKTYPHRRALLRDLAAATDDGRRVVRAAAVAARVIWAALPDVCAVQCDRTHAQLKFDACMHASNARTTCVRPRYARSRRAPVSPFWHCA